LMRRQLDFLASARVVHYCCWCSLTFNAKLIK
jgi:hypothetical protein